MKVSLNWIKEFVQIPSGLSSKELGERLTLATAEVEEVEEVNQFLSKVCVVQIVAIEKHPEADKLNLVTFQINEMGETKRVVCGASNVRVGLKAAFAPVGTCLPGGFLLEPKKIRGVLSEGMLCSEEELGVAESSSGIMELDADTKLGIDMLEYFDLQADVIFDIDNKSLTHRPDLWGHYGFAREFSTIFSSDLKKTFNKEWMETLEKNFTSEASPISIKVDEDSSCLAYWGLSIENVRVTESPDWLKSRLKQLGHRPINSIVDISNYVMLELGIPLHIFDADKIKDKKIHIHRTLQNLEFETLDGVKRDLKEGTTVISDSEKPLVIAGVMGGMNSGVEFGTTNIFIEVANWKAADVRAISTSLGLRTDSSQRYEKTLDSLQCYQTLLRTLELIKLYSPESRVVGSPVKAMLKKQRDEVLVIQTSEQKISSVLGKEIIEEEIINILSSLDFSVSKKDQNLIVEVPSFRSTKDIECEADIIEEVGRIVGYDNIEVQVPAHQIIPAARTSYQILQKKIRDYLVLHSRSFEIQTYPMVGEDLLNKLSWYENCESLKLINSLSKDQDRMRNSLIPSHLEAVALNSKSFDRFRYFELGRSYHANEKSFFEEKGQLAITFYEKDSSPFVSLVSEVKSLCSFCDIPFDLTNVEDKFKNEVINQDWLGIHPFEKLNIRVMGKMKGMVMSIHPMTLRDLKIKGKVSIALLDLSLFKEREMKSKFKYQPISKYQDSTFDYTIDLEKDEEVGEVLACLNKLKSTKIVGHSLVTIFQPSDSQNKFVTFKTRMRDPLGTLETQEIKNLELSILKHIDGAGYKLKE